MNYRKTDLHERTSFLRELFQRRIGLMTFSHILDIQ